MNDLNDPAMSVVLVTTDRCETIRRSIESLRAQTVKQHLEIIIVVPSEAGFGLDKRARADFFGLRVVEIGAIQSTGKAYAAGVRQARAPLVVLTEDHVYPHADWAAALIEAHHESWSAVGPVVHNANPGSAVSWASFLMVYGSWSGRVVAGEADALPKHNTSYKRAILLDYGPALDAMLQAENILQRDLCTRGHRLYFEPRAKVSHLNFELLFPWLQAQFHSWRLFAATRAKKWSPIRRLLYTGAAPLIPFIRLRQILRQLRKVDIEASSLAGVLSVMGLGLIAGAIGEMAGYALGAGQAEWKASQFEFHRVRYLSNKNRIALVHS